MLKSLLIENYALITKTEVLWQNGFSVITGETGSGKSILLGALGLILGQRADVKSLRDPEKKCVVEASFDIASYGLKSLFLDNDLDYEESCLIRREILPNGKSRAFVNDTPVSLAFLKDLGSYLLDIHSQHENLLLNEGTFQLHVLDSYAGNASLLDEYEGLYRLFIQDKKQLADLSEQLENQNANKDYLEYQLKQLKDASFAENEQKDLEDEASVLTHASEIRDSLSKSLWLLLEKDENISSSLKDVTNSLTQIESVCDESFSLLKKRLEACLIEIKDVTRELELKKADVEVDPNRLEIVNERLDLIYTLEKKHKVNSLAELISIRQSYEQQLNQMESFSDKIASLKESLKKQESVLLEKAKKLSEKRSSTTSSFSDQMNAILLGLGMPNAKFEVRIEPSQLSISGADKVQFFFSANKNASLQPISTVASGGEISRVMLSLKSILSRSENMPTIILDEIDTGVSGEVADKMGVMMRNMSTFMQVISITHLPQIAAKGNVHYKVYKEDDAESSISRIKCLSEDDRVVEIAQMLSGSVLTDAAVQNAKDLLKGK